MAKTDWKMKDKVKPSDMNAIGEEINELQDGFIKKSIVIPAGSDLNTYMEEGNYYCPANATVATLLNSPTEDAFHLTVEPHAGVLQTLTTFQPGDLEVYQRNYYFGWGPWKRVPKRDELEEIKQSSVYAKQEAIDAAAAHVAEVVVPQVNADAQAYVDERPWQKFKLTDDSGYAKWLDSPNLNTFDEAGQFFSYDATNGPVVGTVYNFIEIFGNRIFQTVQRVTVLASGQIFFRYKRSGTTWSAWAQIFPAKKTDVWGAL